MGLEEAQLADFLRTYSAGGKVCDAAGFELNAHVRDIHFVADYR